MVYRLGSATLAGHVNACMAVPAVNSVPAPRRVPTGRSTACFRMLPAAYSNCPAASRTSPDNTVPAAMDSGWFSAASTGRRVPAASVVGCKGSA